MNGQVFIITPFIEHRKVLMDVLPSVLRSMENVRVLGRGRTGITVSVPDGYDIKEQIKAQLPEEARDYCIIEKAQNFSLAG
jgi:hypothetical protein